MKVENSIKENLISSTTPPLTNYDDIIQAICDWNWITLWQFKDEVWYFSLYWTDKNWKAIYINDIWQLVNPIWIYLLWVYQNKSVVFEKWNDKFFGKIKVMASNDTRYQLGDKVIEIPFLIRAENEDTWDWITIFPKTSDIIQDWMKNMYVVNTGRAQRQKLEKEIMSKLIELAKVRCWNEILSSQNVLEWLQKTLKKSNIDLLLANGVLELHFPRRKIRDVAWDDDEYLAPPMDIEIDFESAVVQSKWYSCHWFWTPDSWWNPCWWNLDNDVHWLLRSFDFKWLINLIISWAYGYNSDDTWLAHGWRHPLGKLREYIWYVYNHINTISSDEKQKLKENLTEIKKELNIDDYLDGCDEIKVFLASLEWGDEKSE